MTYYIMPEYAPKPNGMYLFEKQLSLPRSAALTLHIFAVSRYILRVDGQYVCEGPCRSHEKVRYYDAVPLTLTAGEHTFSFTVLHSTDFFTTVFDAPIPKLAFEALDGDEVLLSTDQGWSCDYLSSYTLVCHAMNALPPYEIYTANQPKIPLPIKTAEKCVFRKNGFFTRGGAAYPYLLEQRPIPMIMPVEPIMLSLIREGDGFAEYDAGEYMTARIAMNIDPNSHIKVIYSECYEFEDGKHKRDDARGSLGGYFDTVSTADEMLTYEPFWFRAFRYIRIEGDANAVHALAASRVHYPYTVQGSFVCSDPAYNAMYAISRNTLLSCHHEIIVDCPYYEQQQYEFDAYVQSEVIPCLSNDFRLIKKTIAEFAQPQQENGLLPSIAPSSWVLQIIPGYSLIWIMMLRAYVERTKDVSFSALYTGTVDGILGFFDRMIKERGFLSRTRYWDFFDWVPEWENGGPPVNHGEAHTLYHFYYARALMDAAFMARILGREALAGEYEARYHDVIRIVNSLCYRESVGMYADGSVSETYSMHTSIWAILSEAQSGEALDRLLESLDRTDIQRSDLSMSFFLFRALALCGKEERVFDFLGSWQKMLENGCTSWCENVVAPRSECHGWSCSPMYAFSNFVLGVRERFENQILIKPIPLDLSFVKGSVPVREGVVDVHFRVDAGVFTLDIAAPLGVSKRVILPDGTEHCFEGAAATYTCKYDSKEIKNV